MGKPELAVWKKKTGKQMEVLVLEMILPEVMTQALEEMLEMKWQILKLEEYITILKKYRDKSERSDLHKKWIYW